MRSWLVSRHPGAIAWASAQHQFDEVVSHLSSSVSIGPNDVVYGTLPLPLVAEICQRGGRYFHLSFGLLEHLRGKELSVKQMEELGASFKEYRVLVEAA